MIGESGSKESGSFFLCYNSVMGINLLEILKKEMVPAMGCTEPAAAALCSAKTSELLGALSNVRLSVKASKDMIKNTMGVGIPSSDKKGLNIAAALGYAVGNTGNGLSILSSVTPKQTEMALKLDVTTELVRDVPALFISVRADSSDGHYAVATISSRHDRFCHLEKDGQVLLSLPISDEKNSDDTASLIRDLSIEHVIDFANTVDFKNLDFVLKAVSINMAIAEHSIKNGFGLEVGRTMSADIPMPPASLKDALSKGAAYAAAGSDARMSGCSMPVIINSGSGNQGITVTVPVKILADYLGCTDEQMARAVCVSELVGLILAAHKNRLSALCGVFTASIGTACAWAYLLGGGPAMMKGVLNTMVGNLSGIICDGAKGTCALKIYSSLECASMSVRLAMRNKTPGKESGIVGSSIAETIDNLARLCNEGMEETDNTVVSIMIAKETRC